MEGWRGSDILYAALLLGRLGSVEDVTTPPKESHSFSNLFPIFIVHTTDVGIHQLLANS
jgi:hypothetical protein